MSAWVSAVPAFGVDSLDGFAIGALMSGACALAITVPRHARARRAQAGRDGRTACGYRSRHRIGDPVPVLSRGDGATAVFPDAEVTFADAEAMFPDAEVAFPDAEIGDHELRSARRPEARRLARHRHRRSASAAA